MGLISRTADLYYTYRFLKLLVTPWDQTDAFKRGILDKDGRILRRASTLHTDEDKSAYTIFHRLVFNIKRLIEKLPFGKTRIASYAAALYLIKEHTGMTDDGIRKIFENIEGHEFDLELQENTWFLNSQGKLQPGHYTLSQDVPIASTGEFRALRGSKVDVTEATAPAGFLLGIPVFKVRHRETNQIVCVSTEDINR